MIQTSVYTSVPGAVPGCCMRPGSSNGYGHPCQPAALKRGFNYPPEALSFDMQDKRQWLRHNVIHWLHLEPRTHSGLEGLLPNDHQLLKLLDTEVCCCPAAHCRPATHDSDGCGVKQPCCHAFCNVIAKANNTLFARMGGALHHGVLCRVWGSCIHKSSFEGVEHSTAACRYCLKWLSSTAWAQTQCLCTSCSQSSAES